MCASKSVENAVNSFCSHHMMFEYLIPETVFYLRVILLDLIALVYSRSRDTVFCQ